MDVYTNRLVILCLAAIGLVCVCGMVALSLQGQEIPEAINVIGGACVGGISTVLVTARNSGGSGQGSVA